MPLCFLCLSRLRASTTENITSSASVAALMRFPLQTSNNVQTRNFHSTPSKSRKTLIKPAKPMASYKPKTPGLRESRAARLQKKVRVVTGLPRQGQRREERRRIVLSNTSALPVRDMQELTMENMSRPDIIGKVLGFNQPLLDPLRAAEAFKRTQNWKWFHRPGTLIRQETVDLADMIRKVNQKAGGTDQTFRAILSGERGTGKSLVLLQAQAMALMNQWVVISVPEGLESALVSCIPRLTLRSSGLHQ